MFLTLIISINESDHFSLRATWAIWIREFVLGWLDIFVKISIPPFTPPCYMIVYLSWYGVAHKFWLSSLQGPCKFQEGVRSFGRKEATMAAGVSWKERNQKKVYCSNWQLLSSSFKPNHNACRVLVVLEATEATTTRKSAAIFQYQHS